MRKVLVARLRERLRLSSTVFVKAELLHCDNISDEHHKGPCLKTVLRLKLALGGPESVAQTLGMHKIV